MASGCQLWFDIAKPGHTHTWQSFKRPGRRLCSFMSTPRLRVMCSKKQSQCGIPRSAAHQQENTRAMSTAVVTHPEDSAKATCRAAGTHPEGPRQCRPPHGKEQRQGSVQSRRHASSFWIPGGPCQRNPPHPKEQRQGSVRGHTQEGASHSLWQRLRRLAVHRRVVLRHDLAQHRVLLQRSTHLCVRVQVS